MSFIVAMVTFGGGDGGKGWGGDMKLSQTEGGSAIFLLLPKEDQQFNSLSSRFYNTSPLS